MVRFLITCLVYLVTSLSSIGLIYLSRNYQFYQQLISILLVIDIILASRLKKQDSSLNLTKLLILFFSCLLVQIIVISSGGFYSPLLILLHIFTLGAIFLLSSSSPIVFLVFSLGVLIFHITYDQNLSQFFQSDPWAVAIYALSIIIVIPLALYLSHSNSIKNKFNNFLRDYIQMSEKRQQSILTALSNMVIITDKDLKIISINIALERLLRTSIHQLQGKPISEVLVLKNSQGVRIFFDELPIKQALADKATHIVEGYAIETKIETIPKQVTIQIRPLTNPSGDITQIVFVLTDPLVKIGFNTHPNITEAIKKRDMFLNKLTAPTSLPETSARQLIMLITHIEEDILTTQEMEDHPLQEVIGFIDLVELAKQTVATKAIFYQVIGNIPQIDFEDEDKAETAYLNLKMEQLTQLKTSKYTAMVDSFLLKLILEKVFDIAVFVGGKNSKVGIHLSLIPDHIKIEIIFPSLNLKQKDLTNLFIKDYPGVKLPTLQNSSGLEGYIAGKIASNLDLSLETTINPYKETASITLIVRKQVKIYV